MAATTFKQQCPSCEAMVPIRDPKLIGRKIDCPKCKYRFVVEEPEDEADEAPASSGKKNGKAQQAVTARRPVNARGAAVRGKDVEEDEDRPAAKKGGNSTVLILGIGLGAVALVLLAVIIIVVVSSGGSNTTTTTTPKPNTAPTNPGAGDNKEPEQAPAIQLADATNYLPNDAEAIKLIRVDKLSDSTVGQAAFQTPGAFNQGAFQQKFGFPLESVKQIVHASSDSQGWVFNVLRLDDKKQTAKEADLLASLTEKLNLRKPDKKLESGLEYYLIDSPLDSFSFLYLSDRKPQSLALHVLDAYTLIVASVGPMETFLEKDKRQPKFITEPPAKLEQDQDPDAAGKNPEGSPNPSGPGGPGGFGPGPGSPGPGGGGLQIQKPSAGGVGGPGPGPQAPSAGALGGPGMGPGGYSRGPGAGAAPAQPAGSGSYLTISKELKSMMDKLLLPENPKQPALICVAMNAKAGQELLRDNVDVPGVDVSKLLVEHARDLNIIGACLKAFNRDKLTFVVGIELKSDSAAHKLDAETRELLPAMSKAIQEKLDLTVKYPGKADGSTTTGNQPGIGPFGPGGFGPPGGGIGPQGPTGGYGQSSPPPPGGGGGGAGGPPGGYGAQQSPAPGGGGPGPGEIGEGVQGQGGSGRRGGPGFPGFPGGPNTGTSPAEEQESSLGVNRSENTILLSVNLIWKKNMPDMVYAALQQRVARAKGLADMGSRQSKIHDLAAAVQMYVQEKKQFPRGAADRTSSTDRAGLPYRPDQRVSWLAELLPYLGDGEYGAVRILIDDQQSWRDPPKKIDDGKNNVFAAQMLIPYFLSANSPETSWWAPYPGVDQPVASTHFVGIAGVGLDAADYSASDPKVAKKIGVFGYDRVTKLDDIADGLENTIVALQVPIEVKSAWLAGGGSTIRGVPETDPIAPFVCTEYKGKLGTYAIMADGKVRFIPKDIDPEMFKGMCTINGGESIDNLDVVAPVVPGGSKSRLKTQLPPSVVTPQPVEPMPKPPAEKPADGAKPPATSEKPAAPTKPGEPPDKP